MGKELKTTLVEVRSLVFYSCALLVCFVCCIWLHACVPVCLTVRVCTGGVVPDGRSLIFGTLDGEVHIYDLNGMFVVRVVSSFRISLFIVCLFRFHNEWWDNF